jgi:hypothetical protein
MRGINATLLRSSMLLLSQAEHKYRHLQHNTSTHGTSKHI